MIEVLFTPECRKAMELLEISADKVATTINDRHSGLINDAEDRIIAAHWFSEDDFLLVESVITKKEFIKQKNRIRVKQVTAQLAIKLSLHLPSGTVNRDMYMGDILKVVAESFGRPLTCHPASPPATLYTGIWDGKKIDINTEGRPPEIHIFGTYNPTLRHVSLFGLWTSRNIAAS
jgi:hypothetical protein